MSAIEVKICGVTRARDARLAVALGAAYIGLNFWPRSPRFLRRDQALAIVDAIGGRARTVGVWVRPQRQEVSELVADLGLDLVQFHGQVQPDSTSWLPGRVIVAVQPQRDLRSTASEAYPDAWGFLFDAAGEGVFGGSGESWSYERIANLETDKPVFLAGGLSPGNVATAILQSGVCKVDVCSGVESAPGIKAPRLMREFFREVRDAETNR